MWRKLFYSGFETCFGPSTLFCAILKQKGCDVIFLGKDACAHMHARSPELHLRVTEEAANITDAGQHARVLVVD